MTVTPHLTSLIPPTVSLSQALFQTELDEILVKEVQEATHNFSKKGVAGKLRVHNKEHNYKVGAD